MTGGTRATTPVDVLIELTPPSPRFELAIATGFGLANAGRTNAKGVPSLLQAALMGAEFSDVLVRKHPPAFVQAVAFGVLGFIARRRGLKGLVVAVFWSCFVIRAFLQEVNESRRCVRDRPTLVTRVLGAAKQPSY